MRLYEYGFSKYDVSEETGLSDGELLEEAYDISELKILVLTGHLCVEHDLHQQVAKLLAELCHVPFIDGLQDFIGLLQQVALDRGMGLLSIPGATIGAAQPGDNRNQCIKTIQVFQSLAHCIRIISVKLLH
ncbi:hypothetical protein ES703_01091 [subsurface metagenome]